MSYWNLIKTLLLKRFLSSHNSEEYLNIKKTGKNSDFFVARPGFEPRHTVPKTVVLPLYYRAIRLPELTGMQK